MGAMSFNEVFTQREKKKKRSLTKHNKAKVPRGLHNVAMIDYLRLKAISFLLYLFTNSHLSTHVGVGPRHIWTMKTDTQLLTAFSRLRVIHGSFQTTDQPLVSVFPYFRCHWTHPSALFLLTLDWKLGCLVAMQTLCNILTVLRSFLQTFSFLFLQNVWGLWTLTSGYTTNHLHLYF